MRPSPAGSRSSRRCTSASAFHRTEPRASGRDTDRREVDFVVLRDGVALFAVECKSGDKSPGRAIDYFRQRTPIADFYQVHLGERDYVAGGTRVLPFGVFCAELGMP